MLAAIAATLLGSAIPAAPPVSFIASGPVTVTAPLVLGARCVVAHRGHSIELGPGQSVTLPA